MNRKIIEQYENIKLTNNITDGQYEVIFGSLNVSFEKFDDAANAFRGICKQNKPTLQTKVIRLIRGKRAA
ncbi:MAG: hypothetical protein ACYSO0_00780 [Planctomycetota bacterium]|jgi:hypothetical protein